MFFACGCMKVIGGRHNQLLDGIRGSGVHESEGRKEFGAFANIAAVGTSIAIEISGHIHGIMPKNRCGDKIWSRG